MRRQTELVRMRRRDEALTLTDLDEHTQSQVLRLLDRTATFVNADTPPPVEPWFLYINPLSYWLLVWNLLFLLVFYVLELQIPITMAFGPSFMANEVAITSPYRPAYLAILLALLLDMLLSFFKGYYAFGKGTVVEDGKQVAWHYFTRQFPIDFLVILLYILPLLVVNPTTTYMQILVATLIWVKKFKDQAEIERILQYQAGLRSFVMIFLLFSDALIFGSYGACVFIIIDTKLFDQGVYGQNPSSTYYWLTDNTSFSPSLMDGPWYYEYVYAQFFSTGTLSTLAPGPFARNPIEAVYAVFLMILFMVYASYLADVVVQVAYTYNERRIIHEESILAFDKFMEIKEVNDSVRLRVYNYFELKWELEFKTESVQQEQMIAKLPLHLRQNLLLEIGFTQQLPFLQQLPREALLRKHLSLRIQRTTADAGACLFQSHQCTPQRSLLYLREGVAKFYLKAKGAASETETDLNITTQDRVLGLYEFLTGQNFAVCCRSIDLCLIQSLTWKDFSEVLTQLRLTEEFSELRERLLADRELTIIAKKCVVCRQEHLESNCPLLFFSRDLELSFWKNNKTVDIRRRAFKRRQLNSTRTRQRRTEQPDLFGVFSSLRLDKLLTQLVSLQKSSEVLIDQVASFRGFRTNFNIGPLPMQSQGS